MNKTGYIAASLIFVSTLLSAAQVTIPNEFVADTRASASEVNDNFSVLASESNAQDVRLTALEAASVQGVSDQLICVVYYTWPTSQNAYDCVQTSAPANVRTLTFSQVVSEGWIAVSVGGENNRITYIFSK